MEIILDNIRSIHNVGSIFRTADAVGIKKIYLAGYTPGPIDKWGRESDQFSKVSLGAEKSVKWEKAEDTVEIIQNLKNKGYGILALEQDSKAVSIYKFSQKPKTKYVLILGNEVDGLDREVLNLADETLEIPMRGKKESLNVSVAFGVAVYLLNK